MNTTISSSSLSQALASFGNKPVYIKIGSYVASLTASIDERTEAVILDIGEPTHERGLRSEMKYVFNRQSAMTELRSFVSDLSSASLSSFLAGYGCGDIDSFLRLAEANECLLRQIAFDYFDMKGHLTLVQ